MSSFPHLWVSNSSETVSTHYSRTSSGYTFTNTGRGNSVLPPSSGSGMGDVEVQWADLLATDLAGATAVSVS